MRVRLTPEEIATIKEAAKRFFGDEAKVYLFGSRADPHKKGGDIDIFIEASTASLQDELRFLVALERGGIERGVDVIVKTPSQEEKPVFKEARATGVLI